MKKYISDLFSLYIHSYYYISPPYNLLCMCKHKSQNLIVYVIMCTKLYRSLSRERCPIGKQYISLPREDQAKVPAERPEEASVERHVGRLGAVQNDDDGHESDRQHRRHRPVPALHGRRHRAGFQTGHQSAGVDRFEAVPQGDAPREDR